MTREPARSISASPKKQQKTLRDREAQRRCSAAELPRSPEVDLLLSSQHAAAAPADLSQHPALAIGGCDK